MHIEAFSLGKYLDDPAANEDQLLVLPGRGYAVIDGVTDISGRLIDGMRTGRLASRIVQRAVSEYLCSPAAVAAEPAVLIGQVSAALRAAYAEHGLLEEARAEPPRRFGATLTVAIEHGEILRFILIGDSGLRFNGTEIAVVDDGLDMMTATLRQEAYRAVSEAGGDLETKRRVSRACSFHGAAVLHPDMQPGLTDESLLRLRERAMASCLHRFPAAPVADIAHLLDHGISGQTRFQNNTLSPFSYSVFDGFDIPPELVRVIDRPRASLRSIELFTDGYFKPGATPTVAAWEEAADEVERLDPEKIDIWPSVKGSSARLRTDDRTVVIVRF